MISASPSRFYLLLLLRVLPTNQTSGHMGRVLLCDSVIAVDTNEVAEALNWPLSTWQKPTHTTTGSLGLDIALGGGWPLGYIAEIFGDEGSGKTTLAEGATETMVTAWIDPRGEFGSFALRQKSDGLVRVNASYDSTAIHCVRTSCQDAGVVVVDSIDGLEIDHPDMSWNQTMMNNVRIDASNNDCVVLFLSGLHHGEENHALTRVIRGSAAVRVRLDASKHKEFTDVTATVVKNKLYPLPQEPVKFRIRDGRIDYTRELATLAVKAGIIEKKRSWYYFRGRRMGQGLEGLIKRLHDSDDISDIYFELLEESKVTRSLVKPS